MKIAVDFQALERMIEFTTPVTYACPRETSAGGCSLTLSVGTTHEIDGSLWCARSLNNAGSGSMLRSWWSSRTVSKYGSGFQMPGVFEFWGTGAQNILSSAQSGWVPLPT